MPRKGVHHYTAYDRAHRTDVQRRVEARRMLIKEMGAAALKGKDVDHIKSIKTEGNGKGVNRRSNLRLRSPHANRGDKTF